MDHFRYQDGVLMAEDVSLDAIAHEAGTPFYAYSTATLTRHYQVFADALDGLDATICFAVKANPNIAVIRTLAGLGAGADVVSGGEVKRALRAGVPSERIVFSGVGKTPGELALALEVGVMQINVESEPELEALSEIASSKGGEAAVAIRINPDVDADTHEKIATGRKENKFGVEWTRAHQVCARAAVMPGIRLVGIAVHIGSQLLDLQPFRDAFLRARDLVAMLRADGLAMERLDLGGGLGIPYDGGGSPNPEDYGQVVKETVGDLGCKLIFEPGRMIAGNAGVLVSRVVHVKEGATRRFVIVDAAMNDLMRPSLYDAHHDIIPVKEPAPGAELSKADVVGPVCETGDTFAVQRPLPPLAPGDLIAFRTAGAYGASMASTYNARTLVPEVLVNGSRFALVREPITVEDMMSRERLPNWLEGP